MKKKNHKKSADVKVKVIGSGEAFDTDLGNTAYLFSGKGFPTVLFDCGYQIPERLWKLGAHKKLDAICFTHLHADHSFGVVPMLVRYWEEGRTEPLHIIGPRGTERFVSRLLEVGYPGFSKRINFPIHYYTLNPEAPLQFNGLSFTCAPTVHSVLNYTIRVDIEGESHTSFAVSGDGQITEATMKLTDNVDLLFQELYCEKPEIPVHADLKTVSTWIKKSQVKKIVTSHFARSAKKSLAQQINSKSKSGTRWIVARPGAEFSL